MGFYLLNEPQKDEKHFMALPLCHTLSKNLNHLQSTISRKSSICTQLFPARGNWMTE